MSKNHIHLGKRGEDLAAAYLVRKDLKVITRNYRNKLGEIDIIADDSGTIVFVEVKTRRSEQFGIPEEAITLRKQRQIARVASGYLVYNNLTESPVRFDVVTVLLNSGVPRINHICSAFYAPC